MISAVVRLRLKPWVAVEQNVQFRPQPTCEDTHSVPRVLSGMYTVSMAFLPSTPIASSHLWVPSARACRHDVRNQHLGMGLQLRAGPCGVGHFIEIGDVAMVDPLHHLMGTELLRRNLDEKLLQARAIEVEQVRAAGCRLRQRLDGGDCTTSFTALLSARDDFGGGESRRSQSRHSRPSPSRVRRWHRWIRRSRRGWCRRGFLRVGGAQQVAVGQDGVLAFQGLDHHRAGDHELDQRVEERTLAVHGIEAFGFTARQLLVLSGRPRPAFSKRRRFRR